MTCNCFTGYVLNNPYLLMPIDLKNADRITILKAPIKYVILPIRWEHSKIETTSAEEFERELNVLIKKYFSDSRVGIKVETVDDLIQL